jgi:hypothetical protein
MKMNKATAIVLELADGNVLTLDQCLNDPRLKRERAKQLKACAMVENYLSVDLLTALEDLRKELRAHVKLDVKKHYSLMVADVAADKAARKARGE